MLDKVYGEEIAVFIIFKDGYIVIEDEIKEFVRINFLCYKIFKYVVFVNEFFIIVNGKV